MFPVDFAVERVCDGVLQTALHEACREGHDDVVSTLLAANCNVNARTVRTAQARTGVVEGDEIGA